MRGALLVLVFAWPAGAGQPESPPETYSQTLSVEFKDPAAASQATVVIAPLYRGARWAFSSRWDDNDFEGDMRMRDALMKHGYKGTWYLNEISPGFGPAEIKKLLEGGHALGGHSLSHPMLTYVNRNRMFQEAAGNRAELEAAGDTPVLSFAFPFEHDYNALEGTAVHWDLLRALGRAGFYHLAQPPRHMPRDSMLRSLLLPHDGADIDEFARNALADESLREEHPNLSFNMHAWHRGAERWERLEKQLAKYAGGRDRWYCTQNEYAAYRLQYRSARVDREGLEGGLLRLRVTRPILRDLNDPVPLTLELRGARSSEVRAVHCPNAECVPAPEQPESGYRFDLGHDRAQKLPIRIGFVQNRDDHPVPDERDAVPDFPGLRTLLSFKDGELRLALENLGARTITGVRVIYRLPLAYRDGVIRRTLEDIPPGAVREDRLAPARGTEDYKYGAGTSFFLAQLDFEHGGEPGRSYAACLHKNPGVDRSYPQGGFLRLGPIPSDRFDAALLAGELRSGAYSADTVRLPGGAILEWKADDDPFQPAFLDPEVIRTIGDWRPVGNDAYLLSASLHSPFAQPVRFLFDPGTLSRVLLNGSEVAASATVGLREGENSLVLAARPGGIENAGCFLRAVDPSTGERLRNIRFSPTKP